MVIMRADTIKSLRGLPVTPKALPPPKEYSIVIDTAEAPVAI